MRKDYFFILTKELNLKMIKNKTKQWVLNHRRKLFKEPIFIIKLC